MLNVLSSESHWEVERMVDFENKASKDEKKIRFFFYSLTITYFPVHEVAEKKEISFI